MSTAHECGNCGRIACDATGCICQDKAYRIGFSDGVDAERRDMEKQASSATAGCSKATAQQLADALDDIWLCANSGYSLEDLKAKIGMYTEGNASLTKGF